jgi:hypothetical protein
MREFEEFKAAKWENFKEWKSRWGYGMNLQKIGESGQWFRGLIAAIESRLRRWA